MCEMKDTIKVVIYHSDKCLSYLECQQRSVMQFAFPYSTFYTLKKEKKEKKYRFSITWITPIHIDTFIQDSSKCFLSANVRRVSVLFAKHRYTPLAFIYSRHTPCNTEQKVKISAKVTEKFEKKFSQYSVRSLKLTNLPKGIVIRGSPVVACWFAKSGLLDNK